MKKSVFKTLMSGVVSGKLKDARVSTNEADFPRLTIEEVHDIMKEEFAKAKNTCDVKAKAAKDKKLGWERSGVENLENEIEWMKQLKIHEVFGVGKKE